MPTCCFSGLAALLFLGFTSVYSERAESFVCYGDPFLISQYLAPPAFRGEIFYTPKNGVQRLVVDDGKSLDPHFAFFRDSSSNVRWTHEDNGTITVPSLNRVISVSVVDCGTPTRRQYGGSISWLMMSSTQTVQFVPSGSSRPVVLWSRSEPGSGRGLVEGYRYGIFQLTQKDSGYYNFRGAQNELLTWHRLEVTNYQVNFSRSPGDQLDYRFPTKFKDWKLRVFPPRKIIYGEENRVEIRDSYVFIDHVELRDAGLYELVDRDNNVMMQFHLKVTVRAPHPVKIIGPVVGSLVALIIFCCCCVKICRSKKKSPEPSFEPEPTPQSSPEPEPASNTSTAPPAAPVMYHYPMTTVVNGTNTKPSEPTVDSSEPPSYSAAMADAKPPPEFQVSGRFGSAAASSEPQFDIKGMTFPSAPPLSADTFNLDTFTSEKINFL